MESIHNGIYGLKEAGCGDEDLVLIHDAVRPLLSQDIISSNIAICKAYGYAVTGIKCREAVLESHDGFSTKTSIPRDTLIRTQTPQTFSLKNIINVHELAKQKGISDSVSSCTLVAEIQEDIEEDDSQTDTSQDITSRTAQPITETMLNTLQLQRLGVDTIMSFTNS